MSHSELNIDGSINGWFCDSGRINPLFTIEVPTVNGLSKYLFLSDLKNYPKVVSVQNPYSLINRTYEVGYAEMTVREKVGLLAYSP